MSNWKQIETAPKDGETVVWLYEPHANGGFMYAGLWNGTKWINNLDRCVQEPTHWQPLPAPPNPKQSNP